VNPKKLRPKVRATIFDASWLLLICRVPNHYGVVWEIPGGGIDPGETPEVALTREIWEETGIRNYKVLGKTLLPTHEIWDAPMKASTPGVFDGQEIIEYVIQIAESAPKLTPGAIGEVVETRWIQPRIAKDFLVYKDQYEVFRKICIEVLGDSHAVTLGW
jgi:8-oxo-dGTP pyrophosphatase MutT (NUDIX family)